jgi:hypothetical protein
MKRFILFFVFGLAVLALLMIFAYIFQINPAKPISIGLAQIIGGAIAGGLTLLGVKMTIDKQELKFEQLQKREVMPLLIGNIKNPSSEEISKNYTYFSVDGEKNGSQLILYITNVGNGYAKISKIADSFGEYEEENKIKPFIAPNKTIRIILYLVHSSEINGIIHFNDIYENEYKAVYNYQSNSITTLV